MLFHKANFVKKSPRSVVNKSNLEAACEGLAFPVSAAWIAVSLLQSSTLMASLWPPPRVPKFALPLLQSWLSGTEASPTLLSLDAAPQSSLTQDLYVLMSAISYSRLSYDILSQPF